MTIEVNPERPVVRDWIAVDQKVTFLKSNAADQFEIDIIDLAAKNSGGPDVTEPNGGPIWVEALESAKQELQKSMLEKDFAHPPVFVDDTDSLRTIIIESVSYADLNDFDRDRLVESILDSVKDMSEQARINERLIIADWLMARAEEVTKMKSADGTNQGAILSLAGIRIKDTVANPPPV